jgi:hypothetical protein
MLRLFTICSHTRFSYIFFLLLFVLIFSVQSSAQEEGKDMRYGGYARLYSMGDNPYIIDPENIKTNPAYSSVYYNFLWGDIGSSVANPADGFGQFVGFNYALNKKFTLGLLLTRNDFMPNYSIGALDPRNLVGQINSNETGADIVPLDNNFEILASLEAGNYVFGLGVAYAATKNDSKLADGTGDKNSASQFGVNLGIMGTLSSDFKFDASFTLKLPSATYEPGTAGADKIDASNTDMYINARAFWRLSSRLFLVPDLGFYNSTGSVKVGAQSVDITSLTGLLVSVGLQYKYGDVLIAGGPAFMYTSETTPSVANVSPEIANSTTTFPGWNLGAEWYLTDWLIGRLGYVASTFSQTDQTEASTTTVDERTFTGFERGDIRLGVGFRFGGFTLDATVNDDVLREGFNLIGGGTHTFAYLSASFAF